ncbi:MAG: TonB-dependent receptor, partial [Lewinella sp.]
MEAAQSPAIFATVALYEHPDSGLVKVTSTDESGHFRFAELSPGDYSLVATYVGYDNLTIDVFPLLNGEEKVLGALAFAKGAVDLQEIAVTATRSILEVKADRTVFNVAGTINSAGSDAISLLRKAPGVVVGNNDNISVLGRAGVLLYVDGKRLPLTGQELSDYLRNLPAEQIDRIEIITSPGAKYEAEGNGGIIDIRLKREENLGLNGSVAAAYGQGRYSRSNVTAMATYRSKRISMYGNLGHSQGAQFNKAIFRNTLNGFTLEEVEDGVNRWAGVYGRLGMDVFLGKEHTLGVLVSGSDFDQPQRSINRNLIAAAARPDIIDSVLVSTNRVASFSKRKQINLNYRYEGKAGQVINLDADHAAFSRGNIRHQTNRYFDATETEELSSGALRLSGPTTVDVSGLKLDLEQPLPFGRLSVGGKLSRIASENTFLRYDGQGEEERLDVMLSSTFNYQEDIQAAYFSLAGKFLKKLDYSLGLRTEWTQLKGEIGVFDQSLAEPPFTQKYRRWFPNAGLSWVINDQHTVGLRYGRRIARPFYAMLSPFRNQLSPLTFAIGNPRLQPEQINNLEFSYTLAQRYHVKLAYGLTIDQITHVTRRDEVNPLARYFSSDNSARQRILSLNLSIPHEITPGWTTSNNFTALQLTNSSSLATGEALDLQAFSYSLNHQSTITLPHKFKGEISGYFNGPGIRGGDVFEAKANWSLDIGLQRKFFQDKLQARLSVSDVFFQAGWGGTAEFNGLVSDVDAVWDSRRLNLNLSYTFGNDKVKRRNRRTGTDKETGRVGG